MSSEQDACEMRFGDLAKATFLRRDNRFRAQVRWDGEIIPAYLPNPGRLEELLIPGRDVWVRPAEPRGARRTACDLVLIDHAGTWVSLDSRLPNALMARVLSCGWLDPFAAYSAFSREVTEGKSRLDFLLTGHEPACWLEVKSVTLVEGETAAFPDAPTARGRRHVAELTCLAERGLRAAVVFVVQRPDARRFSPHDATDPEFGAVLREASTCGVEIYAFTCEITPGHVRPQVTIPVVL
jgi:sugar fermentation stimulation protein A